MESLFHFIASLIVAVLDIVSIAMMLRMIISLFTMGEEEGKFSFFLACITEPFVIPVRFLLAKFNILQDSPIDWSFTLSYMIIVMLGFFLPVI